MGLNAENLANQIFGMHAMIATAAKNPLLGIDRAEAKMLADATIEVGKQYAVNINPVVLAWGNLIGAAAAVYGPRAFMLYQMSLASKQQSPPVNVGGDAGATNAGTMKFQ